MSKTAEEMQRVIEGGEVLPLRPRMGLTADKAFRSIRKRDGRIVEFNPDKITEAIFKAAKAVGG